MKKITFCIVSYFLLCHLPLLSQNKTVIRVNPNISHQVIDGFGAHQSDASKNESWWLNLFYEDMASSIYRVDLTPVLKSPYSDLSYYSPWFMGSQTKSVFNLEDQANPNGPENNRVRTYTGPNDYSRSFGGRQAPIAVMGPDIEKNINYFQYSRNEAINYGIREKNKLGDFKLVGSLWSPVPWVKVSSGNRYPQNWWPGPVLNTPWPFIWGGNFAGGRLDVSNTPLQVFNDASQGGTGPSSSLTQFVRSTSAYILGYQRFYKTSFYAISIQNELNFEQFYNSATYPLSSQYITAVKALRNEFNKYPELRDIKIMGPEDLLGGDAYGMWEYGGPIHKNLQYIRNIEADPEASKAVSFYCVHGYAADGISAGATNPRLWDWWVNGWTASPAQGIPANVKGVSSFNKKSWMTETSGENREWLFPKTGFPGDGGLGIGIRIHQALTTGHQSAWIYWTFTDSNDQGQVSDFGLSNQSAGITSPKYVAAKHYFKLIRPNANRIEVAVIGSNFVHASAYTHAENKSICMVLINTSAQIQETEIKLDYPDMVFDVYTSQQNSYWQKSSQSMAGGTLNISVPAYGMVSVFGIRPTSQNTNHNNSDASVITDYASGKIIIQNVDVASEFSEAFIYSSNGQMYAYNKILNPSDILILEYRQKVCGLYYLQLQNGFKKLNIPFIWQP